MRYWLAQVPRSVFLAAMLGGSALITAASLAYFDPDTLPPFVVEKLPLRFEALWLASLKVHVVSAALSFPLCLISTLRWLQRRARWHRWLGRLAGALVLCGLVPSGVVLAFDAKGGPLVTAGFLLSAAIVAAGMALGIRAARSRRLPAHARAMRHVVAQMSVAVTSRALILGLDAAGMRPELAYVVALWLPVLGSCAAAELLSRSVLVSHPFYRWQRNYREATPLALQVRFRAGARPIARLGR